GDFSHSRNFSRAGCERALRTYSGFIGVSSISDIPDIYIDHYRYTIHVSVRTARARWHRQKKGRWIFPRPDKFEGQNLQRGTAVACLSERDSQPRYGGSDNAKQGCIIRYFANLEKILAGKKR